jgi:hypothetical protein
MHTLREKTAAGIQSLGGGQLPTGHLIIGSAEQKAFAEMQRTDRVGVQRDIDHIHIGGTERTCERDHFHAPTRARKRDERCRIAYSECRWPLLRSSELVS